MTRCIALLLFTWAAFSPLNAAETPSATATLSPSAEADALSDSLPGRAERLEQRIARLKAKRLELEEAADRLRSHLQAEAEREGARDPRKWWNLVDRNRQNLRLRRLRDLRLKLESLESRLDELSKEEERLRGRSKELGLGPEKH